MKIALILAMSENLVIGTNGKLPWHIPEDLKRFKALTLGHPIIMGRKTFESIGKPLPKRLNIILSREPDLKIEGTTVCSGIPQALEICRNLGRRSLEDLDQGKKHGETSEIDASTVFIVGGGDIFKQSVKLCDEIFLTLVKGRVEGDAYFPQIDWTLFEEFFREVHQSPLEFSFINYRKRFTNS